MLDIRDFITERGGNPDKIRESQRRRGEPVDLVDKIIKQYQDHRRGVLLSSAVEFLRICSVSSSVDSQPSPI
jgi:hypothetical protein